MVRRSIFAFVVAILAMLALVAPALAGGWAVVTLDSLPREVHAGERLQVGFMVRQHGKTPTNKDLDGKPLKPVLSAIKQGGAATTQAKGPLPGTPADHEPGSDTRRELETTEPNTGESSPSGSRRADRASRPGPTPH